MDYYFIIYFVFFIAFVAFACYGISRKSMMEKERKREIEKMRANQNIDKIMVEFAKAALRREIEDLNFDYSLGLYDGDVFAIAELDDPLTELGKYIDHEPITLDTFKRETLCKADVFLQSSALSEKDQSEIKNILAEKLSELDEALVAELAAVYSEGVVDQLPFLKGKINYTLSTLGALQGIADETYNSILSEHIHQIRKKRGFTE